MGGRSSEHEISLASARSVMDALDPERYEVAQIEIGRDGRWALPPSNKLQLGEGSVAETLPVPVSGGSVPETLADVDVVLPVLHGPFGEDGTVQGLLELAGVPYVGAGVAASALCMDKDLFKKVLRDSGVPVARHHTIRLRDEVSNPFGYPVFVKPARLGSSVGIAKVDEGQSIDAALERAFAHDARVIVEAASGGLEIECSVLGLSDDARASEPGQIVLHGADWYDYEAKYSPGGVELEIPARVDGAVIEEIQALARETFLRAGCAGLARVDFFVEDDRVLVNELNTLPGMTATSGFPKMWEATGVPFPEVCDRLLGYGLERYRAERGHVF